MGGSAFQEHFLWFDREVGKDQCFVFTILLGKISNLANSRNEVAEYYFVNMRLQNCYIISGPKCEKISRSKNFPPCLLTSVLSVLYAYVIASKMWILLFVLATFILRHSWPLPHIYELTKSPFHAKNLVGLELVWDAFLPPYFTK